jgi:hypothetical protein
MFTARQLVVQDFESVQRLIGDRPEVFNGYTDDDYKKLITESINEEMLADPLFFNVGLFYDGRLTAAIFCKELTTQPAWVWGYWVGNRENVRSAMSGRENTRSFVSTIKHIDTMLFEEMEDRRKLNRFYFAYPFVSNNNSRFGSVGNRLIDFLTRANIFEKNRRVNRYKFLTDCVIEPDTMPKYPYEQQIIGNRTYPIKLGIRVAFLDESIPLQSSSDNGSNTSPESPSII